MQQQPAARGNATLLAILTTVIWGLGFGPGLIAGVMQLAAPGASNPDAWAPVGLALSFPLLCIVAIAGTWICWIVRRKSETKAVVLAQLGLAALPAVPIAIGIIVIVVGLAGMAASGKPLGLQETWATTPPNELVWTKPQHGLTLGAPPDTTGFHGGTTAPVTVTVRNLGSKSVVCRGLQSGDISVTGPRGAVRGEVSPAPTFPPDGSTTTVAPSEAVAQTIDLAGAVFPPGNYVVTVTWPCKDASLQTIVPSPRTRVRLFVP